MPKPMTPLNPERTEKSYAYVQPRAAGPRRRQGAAYGQVAVNQTQLRTTQTPQIWKAESADGCWSYVRTEEPTTPWVVIYLPTGQTTQFGSLPAARAWTASPSALQQLRATAGDVIRWGGATGTIAIGAWAGGHTRRVAEDARAAAGRVAVAMRWAAVLDGGLVAEPATARCHRNGPLMCGGYLAEVDGQWVHVDACRECVGLPAGQRRQCHNLTGHQACGDADPVLCEHARCGEPAEVAIGLCPRGRDACCESCCVCVCGAEDGRTAAVLGGWTPRRAAPAHRTGWLAGLKPGHCENGAS